MTQPSAQPTDVVQRPMPRLGHGFVWSSLTAEMEREERERRAAAPDDVPLAEAREAALRPLVTSSTETTADEVTLIVEVELPERRPAPRRGWLAEHFPFLAVLAAARVAAETAAVRESFARLAEVVSPEEES